MGFGWCYSASGLLLADIIYNTSEAVQIYTGNVRHHRILCVHRVPLCSQLHLNPIQNPVWYPFSASSSQYPWEDPGFTEVGCDILPPDHGGMKVKSCWSLWVCMGHWGIWVASRHTKGQGACLLLMLLFMANPKVQGAPEPLLPCSTGGLQEAALQGAKLCWEQWWWAIGSFFQCFLPAHPYPVAVPCQLGAGTGRKNLFATTAVSG